MLFNSIEFIIFIVFVSILYFNLPYRFRNFFLLIGSYYFYAQWKAQYAALLFASTLISYFCAILIPKSFSQKGKKGIIIVSLCVNIGLLFLYKYSNFTFTALQTVLNLFTISLSTSTFHILLPIGISFYTFKTCSYIIDIYRGKIQPEKNFVVFALYVSFFPSLLAGPIDRAVNLIPQFYKEHRFDFEHILAGAQLMLIGFFKKVVIADRLAIYSDSIFNNVGSHSAFSYILAAYFYTFQIYCDFSGYSDIAIGCAKILGFDLMQNFNLPYFATTVTDFWRRWHISLSTWFLDYLYIPLGGNRKGKSRTYINLLITMLACGLWHGAAWTFIIWGGAHGLMLCLSRLTLQFRDKFYQQVKLPSRIVVAVKTIITFHIVVLLWIPFRANTVSDFFLIFKTIISALVNGSYGCCQDFPINIQDCSLVIFFILLIVILERFYVSSRYLFKNRYLRVGVLAFVFWSIVVWGNFNNQQFIYFQF